MTTATDVAAFHADYDDRHPGDHVRLFAAVAEMIGPARVLYPGSYVDIAPSVLFDDVTYVDTDPRAARFFAQTEAVGDLVRRERIATRDAPAGPARLRFHDADYRAPLPIADDSVDLLVSLYAGFVSEHCTLPRLRRLAAGQQQPRRRRDGHARPCLRPRRRRHIPSGPVPRAHRRPRPLSRPQARPFADRRRAPPHQPRVAYTRNAYAYLFRMFDAPS